MLTYHDHAIQIENYKMILNVRKDEIKIACRDYVLVISGKDLRIARMSKEEVLIAGNLSQLVFP